MHISHKPGEQIEVDWIGNSAAIIDPDTGEITPVFIFVCVLMYSHYPYVEAFLDEKQGSWITAHIHVYDCFGGVTRILVPDNCKTVVIYNKNWNDQRINAVYQEMAEHYNTAIIPARIRSPKDKPNVEGIVGNISTWITVALRNEQFFSLPELNAAIKKKLEEFSRYEIFRDEELPLLAKLPAVPYELADWRIAPTSRKSHRCYLCDFLLAK